MLPMVLIVYRDAFEMTLRLKDLKYPFLRILFVLGLVHDSTIFSPNLTLALFPSSRHVTFTVVTSL